jgi:hypothetical protein
MEAAGARRAVISKIEKESLERTKLRTMVVLSRRCLSPLFVQKMLPMFQARLRPGERHCEFWRRRGRFFEYPRFNLDVSFFELMTTENPFAPITFSRWSETGTERRMTLSLSPAIPVLPTGLTRSLNWNTAAISLCLTFSHTLGSRSRRRFIIFSARGCRLGTYGGQGSRKDCQSSVRCTRDSMPALLDPTGVWQARMIRAKRRVSGNQGTL